MRTRRRSSGRRGLTAAQQAAHKKAYAECNHTVEGRFNKGDVFADGKQAYKVVTYGIAYHGDVSSRLYGVKPCRGPKGWKETCELRDLIQELPAATHDKDSRGGWTTNDDGNITDERAPMPKTSEISGTWQDGKPNSLAAYPCITVYDNNIVRVVRPIYDDSPVTMWAKDAKLAKRVLRLIEACPEPISVQEARVKERHKQLRIDESHERYAAYIAARGASVWMEYPDIDDNWDAKEVPIGVELPKAEYERITAELNAKEGSSADH